MALTIAQIAEKVMSRLGIRNQGSPVEAEDLQNVTDAYNCIYLQLKDDSLVTWSETDDIPDRFSLQIANIIAAEIAPYYNRDTQGGWFLVKQIAINTIRRQLATGQDHEPVSAEYF